MHESGNQPLRPNRLLQETSPYLRQHAFQPVDWYPWGEEAFQKAKRENKPIFLSIGYSACHWCHVMAHESFDNEAIAALLNQHFVSIKVDREERPDVDAIYMNVCMALNGSGGWPLTVFLTPELHPIFAGTYFPPDDRMGYLGFRSLVHRIISLWNENPQALAEQARTMTRELQRLLQQAPPAGSSEEPFSARLFRMTQQRYDATNGGFGGAPKFPPDSLLRALLAIGVFEREPRALAMVRTTLDAMMYGGLYDQLEGGFARYCVDADWTVPHFEKMLYTQALLIPLYADAALVFGNLEYQRVVAETADWVTQRMRDPSGAFYAALDADSDGQEGKYYVWSLEEIEALLGYTKADVAAALFEVSRAGNFEHGLNVLRRAPDLTALATQFSMSLEETAKLVDEIRAVLREARSHRNPPAVDDKILLGWNGLMISALLRAAEVLGQPRYAHAGAEAAQALLSSLRPSKGHLYRVLCKGKVSVPALLEDYAFFAQALLDLYEYFAQDRYRQVVEELVREACEKFVDKQSGRVFTTDGGDESLLFRLEDYDDNAIPSAAIALLAALQRLALMTADSAWAEFAEIINLRLRSYVASVPWVAPSYLHVLAYAQRPLVVQIDLSRGEEQITPFLEIVRRAYAPSRILSYNTGALPSNDTPVTVCGKDRCYPPVTTPHELRELLTREHLALIQTMQRC